jgi:uncharacterized protein (TIGR03663 family)
LLLIAVFLRFYDLTDKPLHTDEAVNTIKFKSLLEDGEYEYDPVEYHGPSLYYLTLIPALIRSEHTLAETDEITFRAVTAAAGILLIVFLFLLRKEVGYKFILLAVFLTAVSPIVIYYSRYYIHETLLVTFSYCGMISFYLYASKHKKLWIILAAVFFGFAFSTKESFVMTAGAMIISVIIVRLTRGNSAKKIQFDYKHWLYFTGIFLGISVLLFSSFFTNPKGILDAFAAFENYYIKAGSSTGHVHPWYYFLSLVSVNVMEGVVMSEIMYLLFAAIGLYYAFQRKENTSGQKFILFVTLFTLILAVAYSAIPYKTPWLMLTFWQGLILLAAYGYLKIYRIMLHTLGRTLVIFIITLFFMQTTTQIYMTSFRFCSHPDNPYAYSQPQHDLVKAIDRLKSITSAVDSGNQTYISVTAPGHEYWPLPWYLRNYSNVAWSDEIRQDIKRFPVILCTPEFESELAEYLYEIPPPGERDLYIPLFKSKVELRPNLELRGFIKKDLYDKYLYNTSEK